MTNLWVTPDDLGAGSTSPFAYEACQTASYILWGMSGRKFHGSVTTTETYEFPTPDYSRDFDYRRNQVQPTLINGDIYNTSGGCACGNPISHRHVRLRGRPVRSIQEVRIGSEVLDTASYWLENNAVLGIAGCLELCTLTITYTYGAAPPFAGRRAARYLANQFVLSWEGSEECELPERVTSISRQGVSYQLLDNGTFIDELKTGIYSVDLFLKTVNPDNARKLARVFSPDLPRAKKIARHVPAPSEVGPYDLQIIPGQPYAWSIDLGTVGGNLIDGINYKARGQISTWNGATLFDTDANHFYMTPDGMLLCTLSAEETQRARLIGQGTWDLYAISIADPNTVVHLLTSNIWFISTVSDVPPNYACDGDGTGGGQDGIIEVGEGPPETIAPPVGSLYYDEDSGNLYRYSG